MIFKHEEFKKIRSEKRWSLEALGNAVGLSRRSLTNWENGHSEPKEQNIRKLASILDVPLSMISDLQDTLPVSSKNLEDSTSEFMSFYKEEVENKKRIDHVIAGIRVLENKLNESSLVINAIISSINAPIYIKDVNQKYILANNAYIEHLELNSGFRVAGKRDEDFFSTLEAVKNIKEDQHVLDRGEEIINHERFIPGSRKNKWGMISKYPIYDAEKKISGVIGLFIDITERTKNENLRKLMETALLNNASSVLYIFNSKFKLIYLSDSFQNVFGYPKEKHLEDKDFWLNHCLHPDYREKFLKYRDLKNWPKFLQYRGFNSKKQIKWLEATSYKFTYLNTECLAYFERDISSQKSLVWKNIAMYEIINKLPNTVVWSGAFDEYQKIKFDFITENIEKITGHSKNDISNGKIGLFSLIDSDTKSLVDGWLNNDTETFSLEHKIKCKGGKEILVETHIFSIENQDDNKTYFGRHTVNEL